MQNTEKCIYYSLCHGKKKTTNTFDRVKRNHLFIACNELRVLASQDQVATNITKRSVIKKNQGNFFALPIIIGRAT